MRINGEDIAAFIEFMNARVKEKEDNAAWAGGMTDGGAGRLKDQIDVYVAAINSFPYNHTDSYLVPGVWNDYAKMFNRENDPDYEEYKRLKEKFG